MDPKTYFDRRMEALHRITSDFVATDASGSPMPQLEALAQIHSRMVFAVDCGGVLRWMGNGGSAGICSHMSFDYTKNGNLPSMAFSDPAHLTGGANDLKYENVFAFNLEKFGRKEDFAICISSSGKSENILNAARKAKEMGMFVLTLSAFGADNPLRTLGHINIWLDTGTNIVSYGSAENGHQMFMHIILEHHITGGNTL
jgi:D-sedoheptulose 7-phosphate isomerase